MTAACNVSTDRRASGAAARGSRCVRRALGAAALAALALGAGCAANNPPRFHSLLGSEGVAAPVGTPGRLRIDLGRVAVPAQVDQAQWLVRMPDESLALLEAERWASPLRDELRHALLGVLVERHGAVDARSSPGDAAPWRIDVDVRRFESAPGAEARSEGSWSATRRAPAARVTCSWAIREPIGDGMLALAAGHRRVVERLANSMAAALQAAERGAAAPCPQTASGG